MRNDWFMLIALVATTTGCTSGGFSGGHTVAQQQAPQQAQFAAAQQQPGFTQRVASTLSSVVPGMGDKEAKSAASNEVSKHDPISLSFKSGPPNAELYLSMARLSDQGGNVAHARSMYQKALEMEPNHRDSLLGLARLEDREGQMPVALKIYQHAASVYPRDAKVLNDLALCYARTGKIADSAALLNQVTQLEPQKKLYRNNFAKVLIELNQIEAAISHLAVVHDPATVQYNMGVLMHQRGRSQEAVQFLMAASHINPQLEEAKTLLAQINGQNTQIANSSNSPVDDGVLPTPIATTPAVGQPYPATHAPTQPIYQEMPAETAQVPVSKSPEMLPPVR